MTLGQTAVGVKDRVVRILPALIGQALLGRGPVLDESVPVGIAWPVDPAQRGLDRRPQLGERLFVAGAFDVEAGQQHEQRRRIDAAVILRERHLAQRRHLAAAHFMQDLSRFGVGERIECLGLIECQSLQHAARDPRIDPQHLHRGNDSVATECRRIPGNARIGISSLRRVRARRPRRRCPSPWRYGRARPRKTLSTPDVTAPTITASVPCTARSAMRGTCAARPTAYIELPMMNGPGPPKNRIAVEARFRFRLATRSSSRTTDARCRSSCW